ncbi:transferase, transferring glycosyl groups, putative [Ricinus communis]|uniref:Transferase, transferring glycosyl groups, putative n=1 Tax=Ricinus communis TaxID=3988 RepID=B9RE01_RICCO|nr:transferase, transferring glycosyl groups, putative [Ricinus communis]
MKDTHFCKDPDQDFHMFLPGSMIDKSEVSLKKLEIVPGDLLYLKAMGTLDFGEDVQFQPLKLLEKFQKENREVNLTSSAFNRTLLRFGYRKPQLALVFADLLADPQQLLMVTVATALQEIGYAIQVFSVNDGPVHDIWKRIGVPVTIFQTNHKMEIAVDWLIFDSIIVNSLEAKVVFPCFMQEPFKSIPLIWTIHEKTLGIRSRQYISNGQIELVSDWKRVFNRATVVVFPNHVLPMMYSAFDAENYYVIPGSPAEVWEAEAMAAVYKDSIRMKMGYRPDDIIIAIVGSQFLYRGLWLEHALILQALSPLFSDFSFDDNSNPHLKIIVLSGNSTSNYSVAIEAIAINLHYPIGAVKHIAIDGDVGSFLTAADIVTYGSFHDGQSFPEMLMKAMCMEKPIIAPDLSVIRKYVDDRVNGYIFPKENIRVLTQIILQVISKGKLSPLARNIASIGKGTAKNLMVAEAVEGYASLLESIIKLPSEVAPPKAVAQIPPKLKEEWSWHLFEAFLNSTYEDRVLTSSRFLIKVEEQWNHSQREISSSIASNDESFSYDIWEEEKNIQILNAKKRREEQELKDRTDQPHGTWEEVYRSTKRADRTRNDLHERDEGELERTGQPLCIYEPYLGEATWSFLHSSSLYRGVGLSTKGRRPRTDDVDAPSRLPLLSSPYYRDALGEYGAFFAIANRIDRIHKNAWIGFQSWRATARKASLSRTAERALLNAIETRRHGDTLYFWVRMDTDPRNRLQQDFWSFCDTINAGNCKIFVDALDAQIYDLHHQNGHCYLSLTKDKHCYSRVLELLINVWAYHSARQMVYVNPETGLMQEQHRIKSRRGKMWVKWFSYTTLKSMDEDLAEEADSDHPKRRWLWPSTGEVFWQGVFEKERNLRNQQKERRRQQSKDKLKRMKSKHRQKVIGKYVKPPPEDLENSNSTMFTSKLL